MRQWLPAALIVLSAALSICAQESSPPSQQPQPSQTKHNTRPTQSTTAPAPVANNNPDPVKYSYEFTQPRFYVKHIVLEHDANGRGTVTFERLNEDTPVTEPIALSADALARISAAWQALQFLDSSTDYQSNKQFPHLGTMR